MILWLYGLYMIYVGISSVDSRAKLKIYPHGFLMISSTLIYSASSTNFLFVFVLTFVTTIIIIIIIIAMIIELTKTIIKHNRQSVCVYIRVCIFGFVVVRYYYCFSLWCFANVYIFYYCRIYIYDCYFACWSCVPPAKLCVNTCEYMCMWVCMCVCIYVFVFDRAQFTLFVARIFCSIFFATLPSVIRL